MNYMRLVPLGIFLLIALILSSGLLSPKGAPPSLLLGRSLPSFNIENVEADKMNLTPQDWGKKAVVLNVFASWCEPCKKEHPLLMALTRKGIPVYGIVWRDSRENAAAYLQKLGNPYQKIGVDSMGKLTIDVGVNGVPETYFIDSGGIVRWKFAGPLTQDVIDSELMPLIEQDRK